MDGLDNVYKLRRFKPSPEEAVTYFLPRLIAGLPLHGAEELIHHADVYACEPKDLAADYAPVSSGNRFFFTTCKRKNGRGTHSARVAGAGTWTVQRTENIYDAGAKVGEVKLLSFKNGNACTSWVMEEYRCLQPEAIVTDGEKVLCKIHLAPHAYKRRQERAEPPVPELKTLAVTYFLPRLVAGETLDGAERFIHHADIYACEPKDLAAQFAPVPDAVSTGDRFFFTTCKRKYGSGIRSARVAGSGTWTIQKTENIYHAGVKVGEVKHLSFTKYKACTGWVMEEYRCLRPEANVADGEKVLCKIHLAQHACAAARQESAAYKRQERAEPPVPGPATVTAASAHVHKKPAPVAPADPPRSKKMRTAVPAPAPKEEYQDAPAAPVSSPAASTEGPAAAEADNDMGTFSCTWEDHLGVRQEQALPINAENNVEQLVASSEDPLFCSESEEMRTPLADDDEGQERLAKAAEEFIARLEDEKRYNTAAAELHARWLDSQFSSAAVN
ncbi:hypothetical protein ACQ4PT_066851 [Festuca glaucescens]